MVFGFLKKTVKHFLKAFSNVVEIFLKTFFFFLKHIISDFFERKEQNILARKIHFFCEDHFF